MKGEVDVSLKKRGSKSTRIAIYLLIVFLLSFFLFGWLYALIFTVLGGLYFYLEYRGVISKGNFKNPTKAGIICMIIAGILFIADIFAIWWLTHLQEGDTGFLLAIGLVASFGLLLIVFLFGGIYLLIKGSIKNK